MRIWTLLRIGDAWMDMPTQVFANEDDLWDEVHNDLHEIENHTTQPLPEERTDWPEFVKDNGWKVDYYEVDEHELTPDPLTMVDRLAIAEVLADAVVGSFGKPTAVESARLMAVMMGALDKNGALTRGGRVSRGVTQ